MPKFDLKDLQRIAVSLTGAAILSATCVMTAVAPVRADTVAAAPAAVRA